MSVFVRAALAAAVLLSAPIAMAEQVATGPQTVAPAATPFKVGKIPVVALHDASFVGLNDGKILGVDVGPAAVAEVLKAAGAPEDRITLSVNALLVKAQGRLIMVDAGIGAGARGAALDSLKLAGVDPAQITDVIITHSHFDHDGGLLTAGGDLAFPKAAIHISANEWDFMKSQQSEAKLVAAIEYQVKTFQPGTPIAPGVTPIALYGHTPGHIGVEIGSGKSKMLYIGDLAHSSIVSLAKPDWVMGFDADAKAGAAMRRATLTQLAKSGQLVFAPHFPYPGVGKIKAQGDGFVWVPKKLK